MSTEAQIKANRKNAKLGGRPKASKTLKTQIFRDLLAKRIAEDMDSWIDPIEDLAKGHFLEVVGKDGEVKVYKKAPDARAWNIVMDRAYGKPEKKVDITSKGESISPFSEKAQALRKKYEEELRDEL